MNDYKELVENLREEAEAVQAIEWDIPICTENHIREAADAIEQLVKERDVAVTYLKNIRACRLCKNEEVRIDNEPCNSCMYDGYESNFEWRGLEGKHE